MVKRETVTLLRLMTPNETQERAETLRTARVLPRGDSRWGNFRHESKEKNGMKIEKEWRNPALLAARGEQNQGGEEKTYRLGSPFRAHESRRRETTEVDHDLMRWINTRSRCQEFAYSRYAFDWYLECFLVSPTIKRPFLEGS